MSFSSRATGYRKALDIVGSAIDSSQRQVRLQRCRALLRELDPEKPPASAHAREFWWQYRALRERVFLYSERLADADDREQTLDHGLQKAETAIELSLRYFRDVLTPKSHPDDEDFVENDA